MTAPFEPTKPAAVTAAGLPPFSPPGEEGREEYVRALDAAKAAGKLAEAEAWNWTPASAGRFLTLWQDGVFR